MPCLLACQFVRPQNRTKELTQPLISIYDPEQGHILSSQCLTSYLCLFGRENRKYFIPTSKFLSLSLSFPLGLVIVAPSHMWKHSHYMQMFPGSFGSSGCHYWACGLLVGYFLASCRSVGMVRASSSKSSCFLFGASSCVKPEPLASSADKTSVSQEAH